MSRKTYIAFLFLIAALALALRLPNLAQRPLHNDEGVNTFKFNELWTTGRFAYDPNEYHGPTLYYLTLPVAWLSGAHDFAHTTEVTYRLVAVIFGVGLIFLLPLVADGLGRTGVLWAALFTAVSPGFVFYSRYYIHEVPLIFFSFAAIACGWRFRRSNRIGWAIACGAFIGLSYATKETWVLAMAAVAGSAAIAATLWRLVQRGARHRLHLRPPAAIAGIAAFVVVFVTLFSGFFTRMSGPVDAITSYFHYSKRAASSPHDHPWHYYFTDVLYSHLKGGPIWTEAAIIVLALVGLILAVLHRRPVQHGDTPPHARPLTPAHGGFAAYPPFIRFIGFFTLFLAVAFSAIPYKTPWCMLGFLHGMVLLAGFACAQLIHLLPNRIAQFAAAAVFASAAGQLAWQSDRATNNFLDPKHPNYFAASRYNPYVYAHTGNDIFTATKRVDELAQIAGDKLVIDVVVADCWPLPFYLRRFSGVGYPRDPARWRDADVFIGTDEDGERIMSRGAYVPSSFGLRPGVVLWMYVREPLWQQLRAKWQADAAARKAGAK